LATERGRQQELQESLSQHEEKLKLLTTDIDVKDQVSALLEQIAVSKREEMQDKIVRLITFGLQTVFDPTMEFLIETNTRAGYVVMDMKVSNLVDGVRHETDIVTSHGGGLVNLIGFMLQCISLLFIYPPLTRLLVLDEAFSMVSREYLPKVGELLKSLSDKLSIQFIFVTHKPELTISADKVYEISQDEKGFSTLKPIESATDEAVGQVNLSNA